VRDLGVEGVAGAQGEGRAQPLFNAARDEVNRVASNSERSFATVRYIHHLPAGELGGRCSGLAYREAGAGPPILLVHDLGVDSRVWSEQVKELAARHRIVAIDQRGAGKSPRPVQPFDPAEDLQCAATRLGLERPVLIGVGAGGEHALRVAAVGRVTLRGLVLVAPTLSWALRRMAPQDWLQDADVALDSILSYINSSDIGTAIEERDLATLAQLTADGSGALTAGHPSRDLLYDMALSNMENLLDCSAFELPGQPYEISQLERMVTPTLVIANTDPRAERWLTLLAAYLPNCTVRSAMNAASLVNLEAPRLFSEMLMPFMEEVAGC
jgi:pimeloyl-ACP methyl ester carboxylesterase